MKDMKKRTINGLMMFSALTLVFSGCAATGGAGQAEAGAGKIRVLVDSDANNETDDQHAIAYALLSDDVFEIEGITVNKTHNGGDVDEQMAEAVRVVKLCDRYGDFPMLKGANANFKDIRPHLNEPDFDGHEAVDFIIEQAKKPSDQKLVLLPIGKLTNIALAIEKDPSIIPNIRVVWLGSNYPAKGEYNMTADLSAVNYMMNCPVEFEVVTVRYKDPSGSWGVKGYQQEIFDRMPGKGPVIDEAVIGRHGGEFHTFGDYSVSLFKHAPQHDDPPFRSLFDVVAVAVVKNASWGEQKVIPRPKLKGRSWEDRPENPLTMVLWENFDADAILADFYGTLTAER